MFCLNFLISGSHCVVLHKLFLLIVSSKGFGVKIMFHKSEQFNSLASGINRSTPNMVAAGGILRKV